MSGFQEWASVGAAARATGLPARTIRRWAQEGRIASVQVGGRFTWHRVHLPSLLAALQAAVRPAADKPPAPDSG